MRFGVRVMAISIILAGAAGNASAFLPDGILTLWDARTTWFQTIDTKYLLFGGLSQLYLTIAESWLTPDEDLWACLRAGEIGVFWDHKWYFVHLIIDVGLTTKGYHGLVVPFLEQLMISLFSLPPLAATVLAWAEALVGFALAAIWPEQRLVHDR